MKTATLPADESLRLQDLHSHDLLDTDTEEDYDQLVQLAAHICDCPVSLVTLVDADRQWFKASVGVDVRQTPREQAFCAHTILSEHTMVIPDTRADERFAENPLVTGELNVRFYAGAPILSPDGHKLGSMCVIDHRPRTLTDFQLKSLGMIANQVTKLIELRCRNKMMRERAAHLLQINNLTLQEVLKEQDSQDRFLVYELHEQIAQKMAASRLYLDMAATRLKIPAEALKQSKDLISEALEEIRFLSRSILPSTLSSIPVPGLLHELLQQSRDEFSFEIELVLSETEQEIEFQDSIVLARIIGRWLKLLAKNKATRFVSIRLDVEDRIDLAITDDSNICDQSEMEKSMIMSMVYTRVMIAGGAVSYTKKKEQENVLSVILPAPLS